MLKILFHKAIAQRKYFILFSCVVSLFLIVVLFNTFSLKNFSSQKALAAGPDLHGLTFFKLFGQTNPTETSKNFVSGYGIDHSSGAHIDRTSTPNKVYVVDRGNNRVLGYSGAGSCSNNSAQACTADSDCGSGNSCSLTGAKQPDVVIGQADLSSGSCNRDNNEGINKPPAADTLCLIGYPNFSNNTAESWTRITVDTDSEGNLYVPDIWNNRVLKYNSPLSQDIAGGKGDAVADAVYGQDTFGDNGPNKGSYFTVPAGTPTATSLHIHQGPPDGVSSRGVTVDVSGNIWIADTFNNRVLRYPSGSTTPDMVIGQADFTSRGCRTNAGNASTSLTTLCTPTLARINPTTGELYVVDEYPNSFRARFLVFTPPFSSGMSATRTFIVQQPLVTNSSGQQVAFTNWGGLFGDGQFIPQITGFIFNPLASSSGQTEYERGDIWVNELSNNRVLLIDDQGKIEKVIGAQTPNLRGGAGTVYVGCGDVANGFGLSWPGGGIGIDSDNDLYFADETFDRVAKFNIPYNLVGNCLPPAAGGLFPGTTTNISDREKETVPLLAQILGSTNISHKIGGSVGLLLHKGQMLLLDQESRIRVWNNYLTKANGSAPDYQLTYSQPSRIWFGEAVDDKDRLWYYGSNRKLRVLQLPITQDNQPLLKDAINLYWADDPNKTPIAYGLWETGVTFDKVSKKLYISDSVNNRVLRVSNYEQYSDPAGLAVDMVIGQPDKTTINCPPTPSADRLCVPKALKFDNTGNLFVIENTYECYGNDRITVFSKESLASASGLFSLIPASHVLVAPSFTQKGPCAYTTINQPGSPVTLDFTSSNQLVVGNDGYYGNREERHYRQLWVYNSPLASTMPDGYINLPMGTPGEVVIDDNDNFFVQDHTWHRIVGVNPATDPSLLVSINGSPLRWGAESTPTPTIIPTDTPTPLPTYTPTPTPTLTPTPTRTPTPTPFTANLLPTADTHVRSDQKSKNYGTATKLEVDNSPVKVTYLKFDLTSLAGKTFTTAKLRLRIVDASSGTQNIKSVANTTWSETSLTYNSRLTLGSLIKTYTGRTANTTVEIDLTTFIKANVGKVVTLGFDSTSSDGVDFNSREASSNKPMLIIQ